MKKAGWANMMAVKQRGAFNKLRDLEWFGWTELVLRVRGDGRTYMLNLQVRIICRYYEDPRSISLLVKCEQSLNLNRV